MGTVLVPRSPRACAAAIARRSRAAQSRGLELARRPGAAGDARLARAGRADRRRPVRARRLRPPTPPRSPRALAASAPACRPCAGEGAGAGVLRARGHAHAAARGAVRACRRRSSARCCCFPGTALSASRPRSRLRLGRRQRCSALILRRARVGLRSTATPGGGCRASSLAALLMGGLSSGCRRRLALPLCVTALGAGAARRRWRVLIVGRPRDLSAALLALSRRRRAWRAAGHRRRRCRRARPDLRG